MMMPSLEHILSAVELPDMLYRAGIRRQLQKRLQIQKKYGDGLNEYVEKLRLSPIAVEVDAANTQHYEVPTTFYDYVLGGTKKYSSGYWPKEEMSLII